MKLDFDYIASITGITAIELERRFNQWQQRGKNMQKKEVDLKLLALLSGVSAASISNYNNKKKGSLSLQKVEMLGRLIAHLDYVPSNAAKKLRSSVKMSIGYIAPISQSPSTEYYLEILKGIKKEAVKFGYSIDIYDLSEEEEKDYYAKLPFMGLIDGLIIVSSVLTAEELLPLRTRKIPICHINPRVEETKHPFVGSIYSETSGFSKLLDLLFQKSTYKNPMLLSIDLNNYSQREEKYNLFKESLARYNIPFSEDSNVVFLKSYSYTEGKKAYYEAYKKNPEIDIFICLSDTVAVSILHEATKENRDTAVTGYANFELAEIFNLTTIDQNIQTLGSKAFQQIYYAIQYIQRNGDFPEYTVQQVSTEFIQRGSCSL